MLCQLRKCKLKVDKFADVCMTWGIFHTMPYVSSADITSDIMKFCRVTKVKMFFLVLVYVFNFNLFEFSAAILEKSPINLIYLLSMLIIPLLKLIYINNNFY